jgi:hypothetical protein
MPRDIFLRYVWVGPSLCVVRYSDCLALFATQTIVWTTSNWTQCPYSCSAPWQSRVVTCSLDGAAIADTNCGGPKPAAQRACALIPGRLYDFNVESPCSSVDGNATQVQFFPEAVGGNGWLCAHQVPGVYAPHSDHTYLDLGFTAGNYYYMNASIAPGGAPVTKSLDGPLINATVDMPGQPCNLTFWLFGNAPPSSLDNLGSLKVQAVVCGNESSPTLLAEFDTASGRYPSTDWHHETVLVPTALSGLYRIRWTATLLSSSVTGGSWAVDDVRYGPGCIPAYSTVDPGGARHKRTWPPGLIMGVVAAVIVGAFIAGGVIYAAGARDMHLRCVVRCLSCSNPVLDVIRRGWQSSIQACEEGAGKGRAKSCGTAHDWHGCHDSQAGNPGPPAPHQ